MDDAGWLIEENVEFTTRVKSRYWDRAAVIIDLLSKQVKKNRYAEKGNDEVVAYFYGKYREQIKSFIVQYMLAYGKQAESPATMETSDPLNTQQPR